MNWLRRPDVRYPLLLAAVAAALWAPRLRGPIDLRFDAGVYYILGTSIAEGKGYRLLSEPGEISALQYPPLLPAIVAVEQKLLGTSNPAVVGHALRLTYFAIFLVYSLGVYRLARFLLSPGYAFLVALICTLSCEMLYLSDLLQAELPFAAVTVLFAIVAKSLAGNHGQPQKPARVALAGLLGTAAFLIRSAGIALLGAWVGEALLRRQWKRALVRCAIAAVPFLAWQAWVTHVRSSPEYKTPVYAYQRAPYQFYNVSYLENVLLVDSFKPELGHASPWKLTKRVIKNAFRMPPAMGESVSGGKATAGWVIPWVTKQLGRPPSRQIIPVRSREALPWIYGAIVLAGGVLLLIRRQWFIVLYLCATLLLICLTPWPEQFQRYLSPVAPFLTLSFVVAIIAAGEYLKTRRPPQRFIRTAGPIVITGLLCLAPFMAVVADTFVMGRHRGQLEPGGPKLFYVGNDWINWSQATRWVGEHASPDDVIATAEPHLLYLTTGRKSVLPPMQTDTAKALRLLDSVPVQYIIVSDFRFMNVDLRYAGPAVFSNPGAWKLVYSVGAAGTKGLTRVYERVH